MTEGKYLLKLETGQSSNIKILFEVLKEVLLTDVNIVFTKESIKVTQMDGTCKALVYLDLDSSAFEYYHCEGEIIAGVNTHNLYKIIKIVNNNDTISLFIDRDYPYELGIRMENSADKKVFESKIDLKDVEYVKYSIPELNYTSFISIPSSKFQKYMKDMNSLGIDCNLEIYSTMGQTIFKSTGEFSKNTLVLEDYNNSEENQGIVQGIYSLKFLILFTKATNLSQTVNLYLNNNSALVLEYTVGNLGRLRFLLTPNQITE